MGRDNQVTGGEALTGIVVAGLILFVIVLLVSSFSLSTDTTRSSESSSTRYDNSDGGGSSTSTYRSSTSMYEGDYQLPVKLISTKHTTRFAITVCHQAMLNNLPL